MILIGGGSRSGKSSAALRRAEATGSRLGFIATAEALDEEMEERIAGHRRARSESIVTWEEPVAIAQCLQREGANCDAIIVDCLTLWLSNLMLAGGINLAAEYDALLQTAAAAPCTTIFVTNEVGCGVVPDHPLGRRFRDEAGRLNQLVAARATEVYWMAFGLSLRMK